MALIPTTILTGFLGSGKTTLLKRVLTEAHGQKIAIIENEFGEENIDNDILVSDTNEQIIQMSNGCICCTIREDLRTTLQTLAAQKRKGELDFDRVVIETTGLADPGPVADCRLLVTWARKAAVRLTSPFQTFGLPRSVIGQTSNPRSPRRPRPGR